MQRRISWQRLLHLLSLPLMLVLVFSTANATQAQTSKGKGKGTGTYTNDLPLQLPDGSLAENCADPEIIEGQEPGDNYWYLYCTTDPLTSEERDADGKLVFHLVPTFRSLDLVNWEYVNDAFQRDPSTGLNTTISWAAPFAGVWAPEVDYINGTYYMFFGVTDVTDAVSGEPNCGGDNAIGYATSDSPTGPWVPADEPLIEPRRAGPGCNFFWTFDPEVIEAEGGQYYIYYGSYYGGIFVRELEVAGNGTLSADPASATQVAIANRYEGAEVVFKDGFYYLFVSATNCCIGERSGYAVFVGRSESPTGPFLDQQGNSFLAGRVGGTPFLIQNGNEWVGVGHNTVFQDESGQWWTIYHAINRDDPYFAGTIDFTKRPVLLDAVDWVNGWPTVNGGTGPSNTPQQAPAAQEGQKTNYKAPRLQEDVLGKLIFAEEFNGSSLSSSWDWVREETATYRVEDGALIWNTQAADLYQDNNSASVLTTDAPNGNYVVEARVRLNLPAEGCCFNFTQAGLVIYGDDDNYIKLTHVSIWETRQTEFAKEYLNAERGPLYGNTVGGTPDEDMYLRIVVRNVKGEEHYTAYTSQDGQTWVRGGTWTHELGSDAQIGLVSLGGSGFTAEFDYVRVYRLHR